MSTTVPAPFCCQTISTTVEICWWQQIDDSQIGQGPGYMVGVAELSNPAPAVPGEPALQCADDQS